MSYVVSTGTVAFSRGKDRPCGVSVAAVCVATVAALEDAQTQAEPFLGSRTALGAGHRGVGGRHQHHLPTRPRTFVDQFSFARADRRVGRFAGHPRLGQELRLEVLHGDQRMVVDDPLGPLSRVVGVLPGGLLFDPGRLPLGGQVTLGRGLSLRSAAPGHGALGLGPLGGAAFPVAEVGQVEVGIGGGGGSLHAPVHADRPVFARLVIRRAQPSDVDVMRQVRERHVRGVPGEFRDSSAFR